MIRVLILRENNEPEVKDLHNTSLFSVTSALGSTHFHAHLLERRAASGNRLMAFYGGPGRSRYSVAPLAPRRPVLIASVGPYPDLDLTGNDVLAICQDVVLSEVGATR